MSAHTPGPWTVLSARTLHHVKGEGGSLVGSIDNEANARLIAAAPDMLAALQMIAEGDERPGHCNAISKARMAEIARAAIAKATGAQ